MMSAYGLSLPRSSCAAAACSPPLSNVDTFESFPRSLVKTQLIGRHAPIPNAAWQAEHWARHRGRVIFQHFHGSLQIALMHQGLPQVKPRQVWRGIGDC